MTKAIECIRCHVQMEVGYVPDLREGGSSQQVWSPGEPRKSFWTGLKMKADQLVPVKTFRCPKWIPGIVRTPKNPFLMDKL